MAVEVDGLRVMRGGRTVLDGLFLRVAAGSVTGLFGPSGSGKSTLMRSIVGVQANASGRVSVLGSQPGSAAVREQLGYRPQAPSVYEDLTVAENVRYFAAIREAQVDGILEQVGLQDQAHQLVRDLSGGQHARVSLAAALLGRPRLLLLDEPTVGLDPLLRRELWQLFRELAAGGVTLLISSHVLDEARHCDDLLLLRGGSLLAQLTPAELAARTGTADMDDGFMRLIESA